MPNSVSIESFRLHLAGVPKNVINELFNGAKSDSLCLLDRLQLQKVKARYLYAQGYSVIQISKYLRVNVTKIQSFLDYP